MTDRTIVVEVLDVSLGDGWPGFTVDYEDQDSGETGRAYLPIPFPEGQEIAILVGQLIALELRGPWIRGVADVTAGPTRGVLIFEPLRQTVLAA